MSVIVQKFGGTSVADATRICAAARRAVAAKKDGKQVVMVVSARGKKTDELVRLAAEMTDSPQPREMDMLLSTGEQESCALMAMAIHELGEKAISMTGGQIGVVTDSSHTKARIQAIETQRMREALDSGAIVIAAGFQGVDEQFNITTLGRGGSDTTATALAAVLNAEICEIYTDVEGVFTTDPRMVENARKVERISYDEMLELASLGAGVMHSRSIEFAKKYRVPLRVRPSFSDGIGTLITREAAEKPPVVTGVALVRNEARVSLVGIADKPGMMSRIFSRMAERHIPIDMVVQDVPHEGLAEVSFTVPQDDLAETLTAASEAVQDIGGGQVLHGTNVSKVSVVGAGMRTHTGVAAQMFRSLADASININMVTTSEIKISVLVGRSSCEASVQTVHDGFAIDQQTIVPPSVGHQSEALNTAAAAENENVEREVVASLVSMEDIVVSNVELDDSQGRISIRNLPHAPGVAADLFSSVADGGVMVDMIIQSAPVTGTASLSFTVPREDTDKCVELVQAVMQRWPDAEISHDPAIAKLSVMGIGLRSHTGVGQRMFQALADASINVQLINTSEIRTSAIVASADGEKAKAALFAAFDLVAG